MFVFDNSEDLDIATYEYRIYTEDQVDESPVGSDIFILNGNVSINSGTITPYRQGFNLANVFTVSVENSTTTSTTSITSAVSYYGAIRAIDTSGNAGPWTLITETDTDTPLIDEEFIGSLTAAKITTGTIGAAEITLNGANSIIKSSNYSAGLLGWKITGLGDAEFNDLTVRTALDIGGSDASSFHVDTNGNLWLGASTYGSAPFRISNTGNVDVGGTDASSFHIDNTGNIWSGAGTYSTAPFKVSNTGDLTATSVTITNPVVTTPAITGGSITGATLDIGGLDSSSFHVDTTGNIWSGAGTFNTATNPFYVTAAGAIKATSGRIGPVLISSSSMNSQGSSPYLNSNNNYYGLDNFGDIYVYSNPGSDVGGPHVNQFHSTAIVGEYIQIKKTSTSAFSDNLYEARIGDTSGTYAEVVVQNASTSSAVAMYSTGNMTATGTVSAGNISLTGTLTNSSLHGYTFTSGRHNGANQMVHTDGNGYIQAGYINSSNGDEGNNSNPPKVWGTGNSDGYLRTYLTSALSVGSAGYATSAGSATSATSATTAGRLVSTTNNSIDTTSLYPTSVVEPLSIKQNDASGQNTISYRNEGNTLLMYVTDTGNVRGTGAYVPLSDRNSKENIVYVDKSILSAAVNLLKPATFNYIGWAEQHLGFIAQDVQEVLPDAVKVFGEDRLGLDTTVIIAALVAKCQQLEQRLSMLE